MSRKNAATLLSLGLFLAWFLVMGPATIGGPATYVVIDGTSMEPMLVDGDLAVVQRSAIYRLGDVIAFRIPQRESGGLVIHRIVGGSAEEGFLTQGDNSSADDPWQPRPEDIVGSVWFTVPAAGAYLANLRNPLVMAPLAAGLTVFLILLGGGPRNRQEAQAPRLYGIDRLRQFLRVARVQP